MSQENVEIVRAGLAAFMRGDTEGVLRVCDENIEITQPSDLLGAPRKMHGHAGVLEALEIWPGQWDDYWIEILRVADLGDHVVVKQMAHGRGKGSGIAVEMPWTLLFSLRDGKITEWLIVKREEEALKAVGLEE